MNVVTKIFSWIRSIFIKIKCYCSCQENSTDEFLEKKKENKSFIYNKHILEKKKNLKFL